MCVAPFTQATADNPLKWELLEVKLMEGESLEWRGISGKGGEDRGGAGEGGMEKRDGRYFSTE